MARELRKVPPTWQHPKDQYGQFIPLLPRHRYDPSDWQRGIDIDDVCMPAFPVAKATHYVMYETVSEGTPLSPAYRHVEDIARWLADRDMPITGHKAASYSEWMDFIDRQINAPLPSLSPAITVSEARAL